MRVNLKNDWFAPNGTLYRKVDNPHSFPDDWEVPSSAEELKARDKVDYAELQKRLTKEHDPLAIDNSNRYEWPQPEEALLADVTPSNPANDESGEKEEEPKEDKGAKRKAELESMNEAQLRKLASDKKVEVATSDTKAKLVEKLSAANA